MSHVSPDNLALFAAGELPEHAAVEVAEHLDVCATCCHRVEELDPMFAALAELPEPVPPVDLVETVLVQAARPERLPVFELLLGGLLLAAAASLMVLFGEPIRVLTQAALMLGAFNTLAGKIPLGGPVAVVVTMSCVFTMTALSMATARLQAGATPRRIP